MKEHDMNNHSMHMGNLKQKFFISLFLALPIIILSPMMGMNLPFQFTFSGSQWLVLILASVLFFYGGMPFLQGAKMELQNKAPAMMTLIALGIGVAYFYSIYAFIMNNFFHSEHVMDFFWELATLIVIMLLGHWIEMNAVASAGDALKKMAELLPSEVTILNDDGSTIVKSIAAIKVNEIALVKAGEKIPADGIVVSGETSVNEAMITGEAKDVVKQVNDKVIGGSINGVGTINIKITATNEDGYLAQVMNLVSLAQQEKSNIESISDKVARLLFYVALFSGIISFIVWLFITKDLNMALERMVTVLVIACPHALGLAIPLVIARATSIGAKNGLLIKNRQALEQAKNIDVIMMDKTGTLTKGNFSVNDFLTFSNEYSNEQILQYMASLEQESSHPLAIGILAKTNQLNLKLFKFTKIKTIPGIGIVGEYKNKEFKIVNEKYLISNNINYNKDEIKEITNSGVTISFLLINNNVVGLISQGDEIKESAKEMIVKLKKLNIKPVMLTGDNNEVASIVARKLGIADVHAQLLPKDKEKIIKEYKKSNKVMMVGDGINDAPSLVAADVGVAIGAGTDIAIDSADVILVKDDPADIIHFLQLATNTSKKMIQNLWWGAGYNIIAIPLAAGVLAGVGIVLSPAIGAVLMSISTIIVAINAMTLHID